MDLRRQLAIVRAWFPLLVASAVLAAGVVFVVSSFQERVYEAKATLIVGQSLSRVDPDYNQLLVSQKVSTTYARIATMRPNLEAVIEKLDLGVTYDELAQRVRADAPLDSTLLTIVAQDNDPASAAAIANAVAEQLIATSPAIQGREAEFQASIDASLKATLEQINATQAEVGTLASLADRTSEQDAALLALEDRLVSLRSTYATLLSLSSGSGSNLLNIREPAVPPTTPVSPRPLLNTLVGALVGLLAAAGLVVVLEYLDDTVKTPDDIQELVGLATLGSIVRMKGARGRSEIYRVATLLYPRSGVTEAYRALRTNIEYAWLDTPIRTLLVTSSVPGEGKTVTAANLAVVFAQAGRRVLLVDADLRKPGVHLLFDSPNAHGLTTLLRSDEVTLDAVALPTEQANLRVVTTGPLPPNPAELLGSQRMRAILERLKAGAELVIFDSPPLQAVTDSAILGSFLDGTLLVIDAGHSRRRAVRLGREALARVDANVIGAVLNRVPASADAEYAEYYGDSIVSGEGAKRARPAKESPGRSTP